jgi:ligand-binding sensor domain-containing protein
MKSSWFLIGCLLLMAPTCLSAQEYRFARLDAADGLSHNRVTSIYRDTTGFLWIATISGLNRYDGNTIKVYRHDPDDSTSLPHDDIRSLSESPDGRICVVTASGVCFYNPKDETFSYSPSQLRTLFGLPTEKLNKIIKNNDGSYWFLIPDEGIVRYDPKRKQSLHLKHHPADTTTLASNQVTSIV